jgi:sodium-dependent phosphate cotransporter
MFGAGVLTLANGYPIMLGANVGTTITALLAAVVKGPAGLAIALVHLLFNILGILLFYPVPALRRIPIRLAQWLAARTVDSKWYILLYVLGVFVAIPVMAFVLFR